MKNLIKKIPVLFRLWNLFVAIYLLAVEIGVLILSIIFFVAKVIKNIYKKYLNPLFTKAKNSDRNFEGKKLGKVGITILVIVSLGFITAYSELLSKNPLIAENNILKETKSDVVFGIDVSQYQGNINWATLKKQEKHPIKFVIVRATMGDNRKDKKFDYNFKQSKDAGFITGAYHYYDPNENSSLQAANFIKNVKLTSGNFYPVLDIERMPKKSVQSMKKMKTGLQNWLNLVEAEYGVKPIIYTGLSYWNDYLKKDFGEYSLWVAAYSANKRNHQIVKGASIHQFAESISVPGIKRYTVDGNDIPTNKLATLVFK